MLYPTTYVPTLMQCRALLAVPLPSLSKRRAAGGGVMGEAPAGLLDEWLSPLQIRSYIKQSSSDPSLPQVPHEAAACLATRRWLTALALRNHQEAYGSSDPSLPALLYKAAHKAHTHSLPNVIRSFTRHGFDGGMGSWWLMERQVALNAAIAGYGVDPDEGGVPTYAEFTKRHGCNPIAPAYYQNAVMGGGTAHAKVRWFSAVFDPDEVWSKVKSTDVDPVGRQRRYRGGDGRSAFEDLQAFRDSVKKARQRFKQTEILDGLLPDSALVWGAAAQPHACLWTPLYYQTALKQLWAGHPSGYDPQTPQTLHRLRLWERMTEQYAPVFSESSPAPVGFWEEYAQSLNPKTPKSAGSPAPTPAESHESPEPSETHEPTPAENPGTTEGAEDEIAGE